MKPVLLMEIGFQEIILIMVVALLVIGPERMPGLARKAGLLFGKARRFVSSVKDDIDRELAADELKKIIEKQKESVGLHDIIEETKESLDEARQEYLVKSADDIKDVKDEVQALDDSIEKLKSDDGTGK